MPFTWFMRLLTYEILMTQKYSKPLFWQLFNDTFPLKERWQFVWQCVCVLLEGLTTRNGIFGALDRNVRLLKP